ncbi:MAG: addiction module antidote protein [candidate division FCPU426 bacterium]
MKPYRKYKQDLMKELLDPKEAVGYLNAALEDGDPKVFLLALRDVAEAQGSISRLAKECKVHRASLYRMTSKTGNPSIENIMKMIKCIGLRLKVEGKRHPRLAA